MLTDFLAYLWPALPWLFAAGCCFILAGGIGIYLFRRDVTLGPDPVIPPVRHPGPFRVVSPPAPPSYRRPDSDTGVVPHIPGATPQAGPVCPPAPEERTDETVEIRVVTEPELSPVKAPDLAPQFAALSRFFTAVDEARADTDRAYSRIAANVRPDCPLTTHELVIPTVGETPVHRAIADREPTQELSKTVAKILEAQR